MDSLEFGINEIEFDALAKGAIGNYTHKLIWLMDVSCDRKYRGLFFCPEMRRQYRLMEFPAEYAGYFKVDHYYKAGCLAPPYFPNDLIQMDFSLNTINGVDSTFGDEMEGCFDFDHKFFIDEQNRWQDFAHEIRTQKGIVFRASEHDIYFPSHVLGAFYYFTSTSMREHIFTGNIDALFQEKPEPKIVTTPNGRREAQIFLKPGIKDQDVVNIARFVLDKDANNAWAQICGSLSANRRTNIVHEGSSPLRIGFPFMSDVNLKVLCKAFADERTQKTKYLVVHIMASDEDFGFDQVRQYKSESELNHDDKKVITVSSFKTARKMVNITPSKYLKVATIRLDAVKYHGKNFIPVYEEVIANHKRDCDLSVKPGDREVGLSADPASSSGEPEARKVETTDKQLDKKINPFSFKEFSEMLTQLYSQAGVEKISVSHGVKTIPTAKKPPNLRQRESMDGSNYGAYQTGCFRYAGKSATVLKLGNIAVSTGIYTFISSSSSLSNDGVIHFLGRFVDAISNEDIIDELKWKSINFITKKNPAIRCVAEDDLQKIKDEAYGIWISDLLKKISQENYTRGESQKKKKAKKS